MWLQFRRLFRKPTDWLSGTAKEMDFKLRTCPGCSTPKAEQDFYLDERWRVLCLECRRTGNPRKAFEAFDDLVQAEPPSSTS